MRVGISTSVIQRGKTGVAQYVFALLRAFLPYTRSHEFVLFVLEEDMPLFEFTKDSMELVRLPERFRPPIKNILWHQTRLPKLTQDLHLNVLHVPSYRRMLWRKPCPLVATIHDLAPFRVARKYDWMRMFYGRVVARHLARRQDRIIAISENTARDIRHFFKVPQQRLTVIHNGLEHERFFAQNGDTQREEILQRYGLRKPFFLYTARLEHPGKNHVRLIKAFEQFKTSSRSDWQLALAGSDWHGGAAIHDAVVSSPVKEDIRALGFVLDSDLPALYRAAKVFIYPSLYEGFGLPPLEAMASGCPVISSARGSLGEVLGSAAVIINPEDVEQMALQMVAVAKSEDERARLRQAGLQQARNFDWAQTANETLAVYSKAQAKL